MPLNKNTDNRYEILNTYVNAISMDETIRRVEEIIKRGIPTQHVVINAFTHEDCFEKIDSYQFEQNEIGKVEMRLKTDVKLSDIEMKKIYNRVKEKLPYFELNLVVVDELEKTKRGKYKMIILNKIT